MVNLWSALWWSRGGIDGDTQHLMNHRDCQPVLFRTRRECREWIVENYGHMKTSKDLRRYPFGWRLPKAVKVKITPINP